MQNVDLNISDSSTWNDSFESISEHFSSHSISYFLIEKNLSILPLFFMVFGTLGNSIAFYVLTRKKRIIKIFLDYIEEGTYFGDILGLFIDGYIDLLINAYLN